MINLKPVLTMPVLSFNIRNLVPVLGLLTLCLLTYAGALHNPFMMDDMGLIVHNTAIRDPGFLQLNIFSPSAGHESGETFAYFRPVTHLLNLLTREAFGSDPFGYHVFNLLLFFAAVIAVFELTAALTPRRETALITAALFATHPVNGMLVNYITASGYPLMTAVMAAALRAQICPPRGRQALGTALGLFGFALALLCHEVAAAFPLYLAAVLLMIRNDTPLKTLKTVLPYALLLGAYLVFRLHYADLQSSVSAQIRSLGLTPWHYLTGCLLLIGSYLKSLVVFQDIVLIRAVDPAALRPSVGPIAAALGTMIITVHLLFQRRGLGALSVVWLVIGCLPVLLACGSRPFLGLIIEPHWLTFASLGFFWLVSLLAARLRDRYGRRITALLVSLLILTQIAVSQQYNRLWGHEKAACNAMLSLSPKMPTVERWLAYAYMREGDYPQARRYYQESLMNAPADWEVYLNLGAMDLEEGKTADAERHLLTALRHKGGAADAHYNLGFLYASQGEDRKAADHLRLAIQYDYYLTEARLLLARIYIRHNRRDSAEKLLEDNLRIRPGEPFSARLLGELRRPASP